MFVKEKSSRFTNPLTCTTVVNATLTLVRLRPPRPVPDESLTRREEKKQTPRNDETQQFPPAGSAIFVAEPRNLALVSTTISCTNYYSPGTRRTSTSSATRIPLASGREKSHETPRGQLLFPAAGDVKFAPNSSPHSFPRLVAFHIVGA